MKKLLTSVLVLFIYTNLQAEIHSANHPKGEPKGLYLITLKESLNGADVFKDYRLYCPTLTIREVTGGKKRPSHKVKDILEFHDSNFYNDIKTVCANKKPKVKTPVVNSSTQNSSNIVIEDMSEDGETAKVMLRDDSSYCMLHIKNENYITQTNCVRLTNSKHIKIICTKKKKLCKTEQEIFDFMDKEFRSASNAMRDYQAEISKEEVKIDEPSTNNEVKDKNTIDVALNDSKTKEVDLNNIEVANHILEPCIPNILSYCNLPIKKDLSHLLLPSNILKLQLLKDCTLRQNTCDFDDDMKRLLSKKLSSDLRRTRLIDTRNYNEFEIDDFELELEKQIVLSMENIMNSSIDKHIRIIHLNIPVKYSKTNKSKAQVTFESETPFKRLNSSIKMTYSSFYKLGLNNDFISSHIVSSKIKQIFKTKIHSNFYNKCYVISGDMKMLNNIGKHNNSHDIITELTLDVINARNDIELIITSFKLKSSSKRFVLRAYVDNLIRYKPSTEEYEIKDNDFLMHMSGDK